MFKSFGKNETPAAPVPANGENVVGMEAAHQVTSSALKSLSKQDKELTDRLELKSRLHEALLERLNLSVIDKVQTDELRREVANLAQAVLAEEKRPMRTEDFKTIVDELMHEVLGYGPLEPLLEDPTVNDILVNGHDSVYIERYGVLEKSNVRFRDERHLLRIIDKIVANIGRRVDESQPWVDARLPDGSRVNAIIRPCAIDGPSLSIRKFSKKPILLDKMIELGSLSQEAAALLQALVGARMNILISGGTGSGKTTLLNAMSRSINDLERIVSIEDAAELQLQQDHTVRLETRPPSPNGTGAITQRELVRNALRMRPDRIIVGEVRGAETFDMLQAMNTGHDGSMTTVHANTARDALARLEQMVSMMGLDLPLSAIRSQIASGIHFIVQLNRLSDGNRKVMSVSEITGMEGDTITMQDIFVFRKTGVGENGEVLGDFMATGMRPKSTEQLKAAGVDLSETSFLSRGV